MRLRKWALPILLAAIANVADAQVDLKALVEQSALNYQRAWSVAGMSWVYTQTDVTRSHGIAETDVSEVTPLDGTPYERLIGRNGIPLSPAAQLDEDRKYQQALRQRQAETPSQREARILKYENQRAFARDIPNAYNYTLMDDEVVDGRPAWVIAMTPRPDFMPTAPHGSLLSHFEGKLWIDKEDVQWAKAEAHAIDTIGIGWILARVKRGTRVRPGADARRAGALAAPAYNDRRLRPGDAVLFQTAR